MTNFIVGTLNLFNLFFTEDTINSDYTSNNHFHVSTLLQDMGITFLVVLRMLSFCH